MIEAYDFQHVYRLKIKLVDPNQPTNRYITDQVATNEMTIDSFDNSTTRNLVRVVVDCLSCKIPYTK